jgi:hypothetical protein
VLAIGAIYQPLAEILLKVALNTLNQIKSKIKYVYLQQINISKG